MFANMSAEVQVAAYEGGKLRTLSSSVVPGEAVLGLPLSSLIVKMVRVPGESRDDPVAFATPVLQAMSPYPDEPLTVSCEKVCDEGDSIVVLAAALPESSADGIAEALDAAKLSVTRIDALAIGGLRGLWGALDTSSPARRLVLMGGVDCISLVIIDGDMPCVVRALGCAGELKREITLSLLEAEDFGGPKPLAEIVVTGDVPADGLEEFAPVRRVETGEDAALAGVAERTADPGALNALPASWRGVLEETRFRKKLVRRLSVALGIWAGAMLVLFGVPAVYGMMTDHQKSLSKEHARQYRAVDEMRRKVRLVQKYSDHARGALEIMKAVSDRLPQGVTLSSWNYKRDEGVKVDGEADEASLVYSFKDEMAAAAGEDGEEVVFRDVRLGGPKMGRGGKQTFSLDCRYSTEEE